MISRRKSLAEQMGIIIGKRVVKINVYLDALGTWMPLAKIVERKNYITLSAGDENWDSVPKHFVCEAMGEPA